MNALIYEAGKHNGGHAVARDAEGGQGHEFVPQTIAVSEKQV